MKDIIKENIIPIIIVSIFVLLLGIVALCEYYANNCNRAGGAMVKEYKASLYKCAKLEIINIE